MPTLDEQEELLSKCTWTWTTQNGVNGYKVTGPNGNSIFLPATGWFLRNEVFFRGSSFGYWSSSLGSYSNLAYGLFFSRDGGGPPVWNDSYRYHGHSVRPVCD